MHAWIERVPSTFAQSGMVIYDARNQIRKIEYDELLVNVKRFHIPALPNRIVYSAFRTPKAVRAYKNAERLLEMNIPTITDSIYPMREAPSRGELFANSSVALVA